MLEKVIGKPALNSMRLSQTRRLSILLFFAYAALVGVFQGVANILLPALVQQIAPTSKLSTLAVLTTCSAVATVVALLSGGALSDRTRSRWGRRTPSLVISCAISVVLMLSMGAASSVTQLMIAMSLLWFGTNYYQAVLLAILPDRIPETERGFASSAIGLAVPVGLFVGVNIAAFAPTIGVGFGLLAVPFVIATVALVLIEPEESSRHWEKRHGNPEGHARASYFAAFADRDFTLTFASRFLLFLAYFTISSYLFYIVQDYVGVSRLPSRSADTAVSGVMSLLTFGWLLITPLTGYISDKIGRTAAVVAVTSITIGLVMLVPTFSNSWTAMLIFGAGLGLTFGIYFAIDIKLAAMVLSSERHVGRDMGILVVAGSGPTVIAPGIAAGIISYAGFPALFAFGGVTAIAGGLCAFLIRDPR